MGLSDQERRNKMVWAFRAFRRPRSRKKTKKQEP